ncbi:unnamed protein product [Calicophoron daubneyi]|uniref:LisH domain-containing protein n=1 Tax=Calicophoron daubneyi TaxID=300641 RepID=A0AAV2TDB5_CALDB
MQDGCRKSKGNRLEEKNLKAPLYHVLKARGDIDNLKSHIRHRLILELNAVAKGVQSKDKKEGSHSENDEKYQRLSNILCSDHLQTSGYLYALSILLPECGMPDDSASRQMELIQFLNVHIDHRLFNAVITADKRQESLLCKMLRVIATNLGVQLVNSEVQTEEAQSNPLHSLENRLRGIDEAFEARRTLEIENSKKVLDDNLERYQKEIVEEARRDLATQMESFRSVQLAQLRLDTESQYQKRLEAEKKRLENAYNARLAALLEREQQVEEKCALSRQAGDREAFLRRQALEVETSGIRLQAKQVEQDRESLERDRKRMADEYKMHELELKKRQQDLEQQEQTIAYRVNQEVQRLRMEDELGLVRQRKEQELLAAQLQEERKALESDRKFVQELKADLACQKKQFCEMEIIDYKTLQAENMTLKREADALKGRLSKVYKELEDQKQATSTSQAEIGALLIARQEADRLRGCLTIERNSFNEERLHMQGLLDEQIAKNQHLFERLKLHESELSRLRKSLAQSRTRHSSQDFTVKEQYSSSVKQSRKLVIPRNCDDIEVFTDSDSDESIVADTTHPHFKLSDNRSGAIGVTNRASELRKDYWGKRVEEARERIANLQTESEELQTTYHQWKLAGFSESRKPEFLSFGLGALPLRTNPTLDNLQPLSPNWPAPVVAALASEHSGDKQLRYENWTEARRKPDTENFGTKRTELIYDDRGVTVQSARSKSEVSIEIDDNAIEHQRPEFIPSPKNTAFNEKHQNRSHAFGNIADSQRNSSIRTKSKGDTTSSPAEGGDAVGNGRVLEHASPVRRLRSPQSAEEGSGAKDPQSGTPRSVLSKTPVPVNPGTSKESAHQATPSNQSVESARLDHGADFCDKTNDSSAVVNGEINRFTEESKGLVEKYMQISKSRNSPDQASPVILTSEQPPQGAQSGLGPTFDQFLNANGPVSSDSDGDFDDDQDLSTHVPEFEGLSTGRENSDQNENSDTMW